MRKFVVEKMDTGKTLANLLSGCLSLPKSDVHSLLQQGKVRLDRSLCKRPEQKVRTGQVVIVDLPPLKKSPQPSTKNPQSPWNIEICYRDDHLLVVDKPAGLTTVRHADEKKAFGSRAQKFLPKTLVDFLQSTLPHLKGRRVRAVHRIDKETSGLVVLALTPEAESLLGKMFRSHAVARTYLALVRGEAKDVRIESTLLEDRGDGRRGSKAEPSQSESHSPSAEKGQQAITHVRLLKTIGDFSLVECRLETGRTHQVRIHLGEQGWPLCGERIYDRPLKGRPLPDSSGAQRPLLHAATLEFNHPLRKERLKFTSSMPEDMQKILQTTEKEGGPPH